jgi:uncharacterized protein YggL (DUF469 family)
MSSACPEYGFEFSFRATVAAPDDWTDALWTDFIAMIESHGLFAGGGATGLQWHHVISRDGAQATDQDRQLLLEWARGRADVTDAVAGPLIDLKAEAI